MWVKVGSIGDHLRLIPRRQIAVDDGLGCWWKAAGHVVQYNYNNSGLGLSCDSGLGALGGWVSSLQADAARVRVGLVRTSSYKPMDRVRARWQG